MQTFAAGVLGRWSDKFSAVNVAILASIDDRLSRSSSSCEQHPYVTASHHFQRRSWPGGSRGPDPPELPSWVYAKRKNLVRVFFVEGGGGGVGG